MRRIGWSAALVLACLVTGRAQLGQDEAACARRWGRPVSTTEEEPGVRAALYSNAAARVEVSFLDGVANRAFYTLPEVTDQDVAALLGLNAEGQEWHAWTVPGRGKGATKHRMWMRSDEGATASLSGTALVFVRGLWNRRHERLPSPAGTPAKPPAAPAVDPSPPAANSATNATARPPATTPPAWTPARPLTMCAKGDSKERAIDLLGPPTGFMKAAGGEILVYSWGQVALTNGCVHAVH